LKASTIGNGTAQMRCHSLSRRATAFGCRAFAAWS